MRIKVIQSPLTVNAVRLTGNIWDAVASVSVPADAVVFSALLLIADSIPAVMVVIVLPVP